MPSLSCARSGDKHLRRTAHSTTRNAPYTLTRVEKQLFLPIRYRSQFLWDSLVCGRLPAAPLTLPLTLHSGSPAIAHGGFLFYGGAATKTDVYDAHSVLLY